MDAANPSSQCSATKGALRNSTLYLHLQLPKKRHDSELTNTGDYLFICLFLCTVHAQGLKGYDKTDDLEWVEQLNKVKIVIRGSKQHVNNVIFLNPTQCLLPKGLVCVFDPFSWILFLNFRFWTEKTKRVKFLILILNTLVPTSARTHK